MTASDRTGPRALFLCEDAPIVGLSGASTYNATVLGCLVDLGWEVDVLVTSPRLRALAERFAEHREAHDFLYLHARVVRSRLVPCTPASISRHAKALLTARRRPRSDAPPARRAVLGRRLTGREMRLVQKRSTPLRYDLLVVDTVFRSDAMGRIDADRTLLVAHDVFVQREASFRANGFDVVNPVDEQAERDAWSKADAIAAISESDAAHIAAGCSTPTAALFPVAPAGQPRAAVDPAGHGVMYVGAAAYHNIDGLRWFLDAVWPAVVARVPEARLHVVGGVCSSLSDGHPGVVLHGRVGDLHTVAALCSVAVNPVRMGSGLKIKMVDYFEMGLPCVVTPLGAEGFPHRDATPFVVTPTEAEMTDALCRLLGDRESVADLQAAIPDYIRIFSRESARDSLANLLREPRRQSDIGSPR